MSTEERRVDPVTRGDVIDGYERWARHVKWSLWAIAATMLALAVLTFMLDKFQADDIQDQRRSTLITACEEQNARHDDTLDQLDALIAKIPRTDPRYDRARQSRASTALLIDALAPVRDCKARADRFVK